MAEPADSASTTGASRRRLPPGRRRTSEPGSGPRGSGPRAPGCSASATDLASVVIADGMVSRGGPRRASPPARPPRHQHHSRERWRAWGGAGDM